MLILLLHWMKRLNLSVGVFILDSLAIVCSVIISNKHGQRKSSTSISHAYFSTHWIEKHNLSALVLGGFVIIFDVIAWVTRRDPSKFHKLKTCQTNQQQKGSWIGLYFDLSFIDQPKKHCSHRISELIFRKCASKFSSIDQILWGLENNQIWRFEGKKNVYFYFR